MKGWTYEYVESLPRHVHQILVAMLNRDAAPQETDE